MARQILHGRNIGSALLLLAALNCSLSSACFAQQIYKWTDEKGGVHFSTNPVMEDQQPAELPEVTRQNLNAKIQDIKDKTPTNCIDHGNFDCSKGADADGSVICLDGFRDAVLPFRFACMEVRLQVEPVYLRGADGKDLPWPRAKETFPKGALINVPVRNLSSVEAFGIAVSVKVQPPYTLTGPSKIEPYGLADFTLPADVLSLHNPAVERTPVVKVGCTNCKNTATRRLSPTRQ